MHKDFSKLIINKSIFLSNKKWTAISFFVNSFLFVIVNLVLLVANYWLIIGSGELAVVSLSSGFVQGILIITSRKSWLIWLLLDLLVRIGYLFFYRGDSFFLVVGAWFWESFARSLGALLLCRSYPDGFRIARLADVLNFAIFGASMPALVGTLLKNVFLGISFEGIDHYQSLAMVIGSELVGNLLVASLVSQLDFRFRTLEIRKISPAFVIEGVCVMVGVAAITLIVLSLPGSVPISFIIFPLIIWPALRFPIEWSMLLNIFVLFVVIFNTKESLGVFGFLMLLPHDAVLFSQIYIFILSTTSTLASSVVMERQNAMRLLQKSNLDLEGTVLVRTRALHEQEKKFRDAFDYAPIGLALVSMEGKLIEVNGTVSEMFGYSRSQCYELKMQDLIIPEDRGLAELDRQKVLEGKVDKTSNEVRFLRNNGVLIFTLLGFSLVRNEHGQPVHFIVQLRDISQQKIAEKALFESEEKFRLISSTVGEVFWMTNADLSTHVYISPAYEKVWGKSLVNFWENPQDLADSIIPEDRQKFRNPEQKKTMDGGFENEYRIRYTDGSIRLILDRGYPVFNSDGTVEKYVGVARDVTAQKAVEESLRDSEQRLSLALESSRIWLYDWNLKRKSMITSLSINDLTGFQNGSEEAKIYNFSKLIHPDDVGHVVGKLKDHFQNKTEFFEAEYRVLNKKSGYRWCISRGRVVDRDSQGKPIRLLGTQADIHALKTTESDLRRSTNLFQGLASTAPVGIFRADFRGYWVFVNENWTVISGLSRERTLGLEWVHAIHAEDLKTIKGDWLKSVWEKRPLFREFRLKTRLEQEVWVLFQSTPILGTDPQDTHFVGTITDITALKNALDEIRVLNQQLEFRVSERTAQLTDANTRLAQANTDLAQSAKMKDDFLANMSHELRTPLNGVILLSQSLQEELSGAINGDQFSWLSDIEKAGVHLLTLVNNMLDLSKMLAGMEIIQFVPVEIPWVCSLAVRIARPLAEKKGQNLDVDISGDLPLIFCDERRIKQVLVNLISNAIKFTPRDGKVGLKVEKNPDEGGVIFRVWDKGIGIAPENLNLLFKPFQQIDSSRAREYGGTGLGLAIVGKLVELHGGNIEVESELGHGTCFILKLPSNQDKRPEDSEV